MKHLQTKIEKDGIDISKSLETDLLKIMGGQNLESTPHMKFFWEQQMALLQRNKMGRRYHPQVIRFALSVHGKSPSAYRELQDLGDPMTNEAFAEEESVATHALAFLVRGLCTDMPIFWKAVAVLELSLNLWVL